MAKLVRPPVWKPNSPWGPVKPADYLKGSTKIGQKYTAWNTYGQGKPDFGKGKGPGDPYHEVQKTVAKPGIKKDLPAWAARPQGLPDWAQGGSSSAAKPDPRTEAIRRRLRGL